MSGYRCATTLAILEPVEYNAAIQTPARLMIEAGGLIVTDGSCGIEYPELSKHHQSKLGEAAVEATVPFTDNDGRAFKCIGYAGERYGPTLIWQVNKPK